MSLVHLVRHGQASAGTDNYDRLSATGHEQSRLLGQWWKLHGFLPGAVYHGTLERQRDTATGALQALASTGQLPTPQIHAGLDEYNHRIIEGHFANEHAEYLPEGMGYDDYMSVMCRWRDHAPAENIVNLELWQTFRERGWNTLKELVSQSEDSRELVCFTSGGIIATTLATVLDLDFEHTIDAIWRIRNTSVTTFQIDVKGVARLVEFNTVAHLQGQPSPQLITFI